MPQASMATIDIETEDLQSRLKGRTAIITGGCSGIGSATASLLHRNGCNVLVGDLQPPGEGSELASLLAAAPNVVYKQCDITDWASLTAVFAIAVSTFGRIDIVHANAGVNDIGDPFFESLSTTSGGWKEPSSKTFDINVKGTVNTIALGMQHLRNNGNGGSIIVTASLSGYFATSGMPLYTASKHALVGLVRSLAPAALNEGIALSLVAPGMTETPLLGSLPGVNKGVEELEVLWNQLRSSGIPSQGPDVVAQTVCYLAGIGLDAAAMGVFVQGGEVIDIEKALEQARPAWLTERMRYMLQKEIPIWEKLE